MLRFLCFMVAAISLNACTALKSPEYCKDCAPGSPNLPMPKPDNSGSSTVVDTPPTTPSQPTPPMSVNTADIGTFDRTRNGDFALLGGSGMVKARTALSVAFPNLKLVDFPQLTQATVQGKKMLILSVLFTNTTPIQPLNEFEQQTLFQFVKNGGAVMLLTDHPDFESANATFLNVFGTTAGGIVLRQQVIQTTPQGELLNGRAGAVREVVQNWAGAYTKVPTEAQKIVKNNAGDSILLLERNSISNGSGRVVMVSDASMFVDDEDTGNFARNQPLFLNCLNLLLE